MVVCDHDRRELQMDLQRLGEIACLEIDGTLADQDMGRGYRLMEE